MSNLLVEDFDPALVPDKFKNPETGAVCIERMLGSYKELEKKMSYAGAHAAPASPEDYCINCDHGFFEPDYEVNSRLHATGMTQEQAQEVYNLAAEKLLPMIRELANDLSADHEVEKLVEHFGGPEQWKEVSRQLLMFGQKNLPADVLDNLSSSFEGVLALHRMMKSDEPGLSRKGDNPSSVSALDLQSMMRDPKYWRDKDPAFVAKVTEGFKKIYG